MRTGLIFIVLFFSFQSYAGLFTNEMQEVELDSGESWGDSVFEGYLQSRNYSINSDLQMLAQDISAMVMTNQVLLGTFSFGSAIDLPYSRAPEKFYVDYSNLRTLMAFSEGEVRYRGIPEVGSYIPPIFFGFTSAIDELQVISFNKESLEYDFLIVNDYGTSGNAKISRANRKFCISCHQSGTPHFSRRPWQTTFFENPSLLAEAETNNITFTRAAESFDSSVQESIEAMQAINVCRSGCGENIDCKKRLLSYAFVGEKILTLPIDERQRYYTYFNHEFVNSYKGSWPESKFSYPSNVLLQYDPTNETTEYLKFNNALLPFDLAEGLFNFSGLRPGKDHSLFYSRVGQMSSTIDPSYFTDFRSTIDLNSVVNRVGGIEKITSQNPIHGTGVENPVSLRSEVGHIEKSLAPEALMRANNVGACFFLDESFVTRFNRDKTVEQLFHFFLNSIEIDEIVRSSWPMSRDVVETVLRNTNTNDLPLDLATLANTSTESSTQPSVHLNARSAISNLVEADSLDSDLVVKLQRFNCDSTTSLSLRGKVRAEFLTFEQEYNKILAGEAIPLSRSHVQGIVTRSCAQCHDPGNEKTILPISMDLDSLSFWGSQYDRSTLATEKVACMNMPPAFLVNNPNFDHGTKTSLSPRERASLVYWMKQIHQEH